jgi:hypothetical protein
MKLSHTQTHRHTHTHTQTFEYVDFLQVSSAKRFINISETVRVIDLKFMDPHVQIKGSAAAPLLPWWQKLELKKYLYSVQVW